LDVRSDADIQSLARTVQDMDRPVDLLFNNAGINKRGLSSGEAAAVNELGFVERAPMLEMFEINAIAPLLISQSLAASFNRSGAFIINISSSRASINDEFSNKTGNYGYRASKAAMNMITNASTCDLPEYVHTFSVHPGSVKSGMNAKGSDSPDVQAESILAIVETWDGDLNGQFLRYSGEKYD
ncbi:MAG TPA: SDR family NAD(P)-dependent oxidoreductase, partial [Gammaproteobacteria bacterium]|nr:SDR family NAD(P)-dependent oxidoreductase [Gammaproteobacteria bacterium]